MRIVQRERMGIETQVDEGVLHVVINRPDASNSLDPDAFAELAATWRRLEEDDALSVAVITGAGGRAFCAGADLKQAVPSTLASSDLTDNVAALLLEHRPSKPIIAAVNGYCIGAGLILALGADIRIAAESAVFGLGGVRLGYYAPGAVPRLVEQVGPANAATIALQGKRLSAERALAIGLISEVVSGEALPKAAADAAREIASFDPLTVRAIVSALHEVGGTESGLARDRAVFERWLTQRSTTQTNAGATR
jgi:E-phenylitaconyl-CoA hydratase